MSTSIEEGIKTNKALLELDESSDHTLDICCEMCDIRPSDIMNDELLWFVGEDWGDWHDTYICENCVTKMNEAIKVKKFYNKSKDKEEKSCVRNLE